MNEIQIIRRKFTTHVSWRWVELTVRKVGQNWVAETDDDQTPICCLKRRDAATREAVKWCRERKERYEKRY